jgi:hypothetical protein
VPLILRKIRKAKWYRSDAVPWLAREDLQADALVDLATKGNRLSVYVVEDDQSNLERIIAGLAANCDFISDFDYALFADEALDEIKINVEDTNGETPDAVVNSWHRDLVELSAANIFALANVIGTRAERKRVLSRRVLQLVAHAVATGQIERGKLRLKRDQIAKVDRVLKLST